MELTLLALLVVGAVGFGVWQAISQDDAWKHLAEDLGLELDASFWRGRRMKGVSSGFPVRTERVADDEQENVRVLVDCDRAPAELKFRTRALSVEDLWRDRFRTGDDTFDRRVDVRGPADVAAAFLGSETRRAIWDLLVRGGTLDAGCLRLVVGGRGELGEVREAVRWLTWLAERIPERRALREALLDNARRDPEPHVRLQNLTLLPRDAALEIALADSAPAVRLWAAEQVGGAQSSAILRELLEKLPPRDESVLPAIRAAARAADPALADALRALALRSDADVAAAAAAALRELGVPAGGLSIADAAQPQGALSVAGGGELSLKK